jgi:hypothetical protein
MDTLNPVLYMDFPQGRLKFMGTIVHGTNRWLTLSFGKRHVQCEDCFDHLVVFSDWSWVGKKSVNPDERRLPLPMELRDLKVHTNPNFAAGAADDGSKPLASSGGATTTPRTIGRKVAIEDMEADSDSSDDGEENFTLSQNARSAYATSLIPLTSPADTTLRDSPVPSKSYHSREVAMKSLALPGLHSVLDINPKSPCIRRRSSRAAATKHVKYTDGDEEEDAEGGEEGASSDDESDEGLKAVVAAASKPSTRAASSKSNGHTPNAKAAASPAKGKRKPEVVDLDSKEEEDEEEEEEEEEAGPVAKNRGSTGAAAKRRATVVSDEDSDKGEDAGPVEAAARKKPSRRSMGVMKSNGRNKPVKNNGGDSEEEESEEERVDDDSDFEMSS